MLNSPTFIAVYRKGTRTMLRLPHSRNDIVIDEETIPNPFRAMVHQYGNALVMFRYKRPKNLAMFIPSEGQEKEEPKKKEEKKRGPFWKRNNFGAGQFIIMPTRPRSMDASELFRSASPAYEAAEEQTRVVATLMHYGIDPSKVGPNSQLPDGLYMDSEGKIRLLPMTPLISSILRNDSEFGTKKYIKKMFTSHLQFIRQNIDGAMYGEENPDLTHDPENEGSPDRALHH